MTWKKIRLAITFLITAFILYIIYSDIDIDAFSNIFSGMNHAWFWLGMSIFVMSALITSYRYLVMLSTSVRIPIKTSLKLYFAGNSLNVVLPSKIGDMSKAIFLKKEGIIGLPAGFSSVVAEKIFDVAGLSVVMLTGLALLPPNSNFTPQIKHTIVAVGLVFLFLPSLIYFFDFKRFKFLKRFAALDKIFLEVQNFLENMKKKPAKLVLAAILSVASWFIQVFQIFCFFKAFSNDAEIVLTFALVPIAIFIGLIPIAFAGIGTRDKALIVLFGWYGYPDYLMAAVGLMCTVRYIIPALCGLPFMIKYFSKDKEIITN
ncbi:MAG: flippase-like domain-containing protein [Candidatus Aureabacteria bacterium]|nr:flippase-like domain-containing protein [Candidatus Auribacterota bacterium]MCK5655205.1 flippase-like domain-containing protein [Candidatus Auribacterota bacterium]